MKQRKPQIQAWTITADGHILPPMPAQEGQIGVEVKPYLVLVNDGLLITELPAPDAEVALRLNAGDTRYARDLYAHAVRVLRAERERLIKERLTRLRFDLERALDTIAGEYASKFRSPQEADAFVRTLWQEVYRC